MAESRRENAHQQYNEFLKAALDVFSPLAGENMQAYCDDLWESSQNEGNYGAVAAAIVEVLRTKHDDAYILTMPKEEQAHYRATYAAIKAYFTAQGNPNSKKISEYFGFAVSYMLEHPTQFEDEEGRLLNAKDVSQFWVKQFSQVIELHDNVRQESGVRGTFGEKRDERREALELNLEFHASDTYRQLSQCEHAIQEHMAHTARRIIRERHPGLRATNAHDHELSDYSASGVARGVIEEQTDVNNISRDYLILFGKYWLMASLLHDVREAIAERGSEASCQIILSKLGEGEGAILNSPSVVADGMSGSDPDVYHSIEDLLRGPASQGTQVSELLEVFKPIQGQIETAFSSREGQKYTFSEMMSRAQVASGFMSLVSKTGLFSASRGQDVLDQVRSTFETVQTDNRSANGLAGV